jgi:hypothetical protein
VSVVWYIVASNPTLPRCDLVRVCEGVGVNPATARTQVQAALKSYRANGYPAIPQGEGTATTQDTEASGITPKDDPTQVPTEENTKP